MFQLLLVNLICCQSCWNECNKELVFQGKIPCFYEYSLFFKSSQAIWDLAFVFRVCYYSLFKTYLIVERIYLKYSKVVWPLEVAFRLLFERLEIKSHSRLTNLVLEARLSYICLKDLLDNTFHCNYKVRIKRRKYYTTKIGEI